MKENPISSDEVRMTGTVAPTASNSNANDDDGSNDHEEDCSDVANDDCEVNDIELSQSQVVENDDMQSQFPIASVLVDPYNSVAAYPNFNGSGEGGAISFAIGEPFVLESDERPVYLRKRVICFLSVMFFNATLIVILLTIRDQKPPDIPGPPGSPPTLGKKDRETIKSYIVKHTNASLEVLDDPTSQQYSALEFLVETDIFTLEPKSDGEIEELLYVQRYVELLVMLSISGKPHLILPEYVASRSDDDFIDTMHVSLTELPTEPGFVPEEIGYLSKLRTLLLRGNGIGGTIPSSLGLLTNLVTLDLRDNTIGGTIPSEIGDLEAAANIYLNNNELTGDVPLEFLNLDVITLTLHKNNLSGNVTFMCVKDFQDNVEIGGEAFEGFTADCIDKVECDCCTSCF